VVRVTEVRWRRIVETLTAVTAIPTLQKNLEISALQRPMSVEPEGGRKESRGRMTLGNRYNQNRRETKKNLTSANIMINQESKYQDALMVCVGEVQGE
jgi:hypothetical protein